MHLLSRLAYSPFLAQMVVTRRCNLTCGYCNEFDEDSAPVALPILKQRVDKLKELGTFSLEFTGGEPLLNPDIFQVVAYAREQRFTKVMMISNAFLMNAEKIQALNEAGLMELQVSVDGVEPNETTIKALRPLRPKLELLARHAKFKVVLSAVLGAAYPKEVLQVVTVAKELGFSPRVLVLHNGKGQMQLSAGEVAAFAQVKAALGSRRFREAGDYRDRILRDGSAPFRCRAGSRYLYVDEFGIVHWCSQTRGLFTKPLLEYSTRDLVQQFHTRKSCANSCPLGCARTQSAYDEWRGQSLTFTQSKHLPVV